MNSYSLIFLHSLVIFITHDIASLKFSESVA